MKTMKKIQILMLSAVMLFVFANPVFSAMSTQTTSAVDLIDVEKSAPGTKLTGPLTIYYANYDADAKTADMYVFLRLRKGYKLNAFATVIHGVIYTPDHIDTMTGNITDFIATIVLPELFDGVAPPFAIKSVDQIVEDDPYCNFCSGEINIAIMDITIAVQD